MIKKCTYSPSNFPEEDWKDETLCIHVKIYVKVKVFCVILVRKYFPDFIKQNTLCLSNFNYTV